VRDIYEVLEEFARDIFISRILFGEFESDSQHVEAVHAHPTRAIRLFKSAAGWKRRGAVKDPDVIEAEEASLKNIGAVGVFAIDPPGEIQEQLVKNFFQEGAVGDAADATLYFVDTPSGPGVNRRIHVAEGPFISGQLPVGMHVPFAQKEIELLLRESRIDF
jgi:hypothetical protein